MISIEKISGELFPIGLEIDTKMFKTTTGVAIGALLIIGLIVALYTIYW